MSLFRRKSFKSNFTTRPEAESDENYPVLKKKRTFLLHSRSESSPPQIHHHEPLASPVLYQSNKENRFLSSLQRSSSRKLQKRPLSGSSIKKTPDATTSNYILEKPPRISSKDYSQTYQNLYILDSGEDDEMYTLFEMINGNRPIVYGNTLTPELSSSETTTPDLSMEQQPYQEPTTNTKHHSRTTSSSSSASSMSNTTHQTEFSDFQFDFGFEENSLVPRANAQDIFQRKQQTANMSIIKEQPVEQSDYEDFLEDLISDDSDYDSDDDEDIIFEEGEAVEVSLLRSCRPSIITIRSSCEF